MIYNWQYSEWPRFRYDLSRLALPLQRFERNLGRLEGLEKGLSKGEHDNTLVEMMVTEAIMTAAIEGENLHLPDVVSSVRKQLDLQASSAPIKDLRAKGIASVLAGMRSTYAESLTEAQLFSWHRAILGHAPKIRSGQWRKHKEPMQIVSGAVGREIVHFEAPPSKGVAKEMKQFIAWFNDTAPGAVMQIAHAPVRAAVAHLYFESIHPFEDGNGRIGRVLAEKALVQTIGAPLLMSVSASIEKNKDAYYLALKTAQRGLKIDAWLDYFIEVIINAQESAQQTIVFTLKKARFYDQFRDQLNPRQLKAIERMFMSGPAGFEGGMTATKYMRITNSSKATATRDLHELQRLGALIPKGKGRGTRYELSLI
jgi:Fic family protein